MLKCGEVIVCENVITEMGFQENWLLWTFMAHLIHCDWDIKHFGSTPLEGGVLGQSSTYLYDNE